MKILVIEDSRFLRTAIERLLVKAGYEVTSIADGREALAAARKTLPSLILLDMMLPGLEGTGVMKELKQDGVTSQIPVIVLTGLSQKNESKLKRAGAAGYIEKSSIDFGKNADPLFQAIAGVIGKGEDFLRPERQTRSTAKAETAISEGRVGTPEGAA